MENIDKDVAVSVVNVSKEAPIQKMGRTWRNLVVLTHDLGKTSPIIK